MKKLIRILMSAVIVTALAITCAFSAFAENDTSGYVSKEEIIEELWGQYWDTNDTDPTEFPESSWDYYILNDWLERNYGHEVLIDKVINSSRCNWTKLSDISRKYRDYREQLTENWDFDDEDGNWYINEYDPETEKVGNRLYHFNFNQGEWSMIDENGDTVYSFPPMTSYVEKEEDDDDDDDGGAKIDVGEYVLDPDTGELVEKKPSTDESKVSSENSNVTSGKAEQNGEVANGGEAANGGARVTGQVAEKPQSESSDEESKAVTSTTDEAKESSSSSNSILIVLAIIILIGIIVVIIIYLKRKKEEKK